MLSDRLLLVAVVVVWTAVFVVGFAFVMPITSDIYGHRRPEYGLDR